MVLGASVMIPNETDGVALPPEASFGPVDCRENTIVHTQMESALAIRVLSDPKTAQYLSEYVDFLISQGAFSTVDTPAARAVYGFILSIYKPIRAGLWSGDRDVSWSQWMYTFIQTDWVAFLGDYDADITKPCLGAADERDIIFSRPDTATAHHIREAIRESKIGSFNEIRSMFATRRKTNICYPPTTPDTPMGCGNREDEMQKFHFLFQDGYRGRTDRPADELRRKGSLINQIAGTTNSTSFLLDAQCFFKLPIRHEGKGKFMKVKGAVNVGQYFDKVGAPFIAGPSGTAKQIALTLESSPMPFDEPSVGVVAGMFPSMEGRKREKILLASSMLVLAGGHHSAVELLFGLHVMGYLLDVKGLFVVTEEYDSRRGPYRRKILADVSEEEFRTSCVTTLTFRDILQSLEEKARDFGIRVESIDYDAVVTHRTAVDHLRAAEIAPLSNVEGYANKRARRHPAGPSRLAWQGSGRKERSPNSERDRSPVRGSVSPRKLRRHERPGE